MTNEATQPAVSGLPPLPVRYNTGNDIGDGPELYTRDQMRDYARAAQRLAIEAAGNTDCAHSFVYIDFSTDFKCIKCGKEISAVEYGKLMRPSPSNSVLVEAADELEKADMCNGERRLELARQLRTASSGEDAAQWIAVTERLPAVEEEVLTFWAETKCAAITCIEASGLWEFEDGHVSKSRPTHWMPLPAAPSDAARGAGAK